MKYTEEEYYKHKLIKHTKLIRPWTTWQCCKCNSYVARQPMWKGKYHLDGARWFVCTTCAPTQEEAVNIILNCPNGKAYL